MSKKVLVIPDVHQDWQTADAILQKHKNDVDHVVFLGDYFDSHVKNSYADLKGTAAWLAKNIGDPKITFLMGNHDVAYAYKGNRTSMCPGYDTLKMMMVEEHLTLAQLQSLKIHTMIDGIVYCHAGFQYPLLHSAYHSFKSYSKAMIPMANEDTVRAYRNDLDNHPFVQADHYRARYGARWGGPLWADFRALEVAPKTIQVVGHTVFDNPVIAQKVKGEKIYTNILLNDKDHISIPFPKGSFNLGLDTALKTYSIIIAKETIQIFKTPC